VIYIDDRTGSVEMAPLFMQHRLHPAITVKRLPAADFCFAGHGPNGPANIGVERKVIYGKTKTAGMQFRDLLSSIRTGRLSGEQLPKLADHYEVIIIIVEGIFRSSPDTGMLEVWERGEWSLALCGKTPFPSSELYRYMLTLSFQPRVSVVFLPSARETVEYVADTLPGYFQKPWDEHRAHVGLHTPPLQATLGKASTVRRVAAVLNGVGWTRSAALNEYIHCPADLVCKDHQACIAAGMDRKPKDWAEVDGFGKVLSKRVWQELHGEVDGGDGID
jgi:hypothetical protein